MFSPEPNVEVAVADMLIVLAPVSPNERSVPGVVVPIPILPPDTTSWLVPTTKPFETRVSAPLLAKLEVAVLPKYAGPYAEKSEVEALVNC